PDDAAEEVSPTVTADDLFTVSPETPDAAETAKQVRRLILHPLRGIAELSAALGPVGLFPLGVLLGLAAVERLDAVAFGVLSPEIRHTFHLSNAGFGAVVSLSGAVPILLSVPVGYLADRWHRVRITQIA